MGRTFPGKCWLGFTSGSSWGSYVPTRITWRTLPEWSRAFWEWKRWVSSLAIRHKGQINVKNASFCSLWFDKVTGDREMADNATVSFYRQHHWLDLKGFTNKNQVPKWHYPTTTKNLAMVCAHDIVLLAWRQSEEQHHSFTESKHGFHVYGWSLK